MKRSLPTRTGPCRILKVLCLCLALASTPSATAAAAAPAEDVRKELTVELVFGGTMEGTLPSTLTWSPGGTRVAFLKKDGTDGLGGTDRLYVHDLESAATIPLTPARGEGAKLEETKLEVASFSWSPKGDSILAQAGEDLYLLAVPAVAPRRLTHGGSGSSDAKFSPDGSMIGFVRDHDLFVLDIASGVERPLTGGRLDGVLNGEVDWVYGEEFDLTTAWWWSEDSSRIAYMQFDERQVPVYPIVDWIPVHPKVESERYPKAGDPNPVVRVGVVSAIALGEDAGPTVTRWLDLGAENDVYIPRVAWTPGGRLAVQRLNRDQTRLELLVCDPGPGAPRVILEERDPHWINIASDWKFLKGGTPSGRFIWGSERDGYRHLFLYEEDGRLVRRLTGGAWMVTKLAAVDEGAGLVYFEATEKSVLERHLYRVGLDGSGFTRLTREEGWHLVDVADAGGGFVDTFSTAAVPPSVTLRRADGSPDRVLDEGLRAEVARYRTGRSEFRNVPADDGTRLQASITLPPDFNPARKYPVLVYVYGGPLAQVVKNGWWDTRALWHHLMAGKGYIIWSLDNRGSGNRGHAWETPIFRDMGRQELADQLAGVAYLKTLPYVDASRIGIWGWSYGGYMTLYCLLTAPDVFKAGVSVAPVTDWNDYDTIYTERYMDRPADNPEGYRESAPLQRAAKLKAALLLVHGSADDNVHLGNSVQILDAFVREGKPVEFMLYPRKNHGIRGKEARTHLFSKITDFLLGKL